MGVKLKLFIKISIYEWNLNFKTNKEFGVNLGFRKNHDNSRIKVKHQENRPVGKLVTGKSKRNFKSK